MNWMRIAITGLAALCLPLQAVFAAGTDETLLKKIRAAAQQFDEIANRMLPQGPDLMQVREQYLNVLKEAAAAGDHSQSMREMAEVFVLSGGEAGILKHWKAGLDPGSVEDKIFEGVLAYGEGKTLEAETKLLRFDPVKMYAWRGGHLALAQALLTVRAGPKRAFHHLKIAALLLPGTLVEEAALRQSAILAARTSNAAEFSLAATTYFRRFPRSAYLAGFEAQAVYYIVRFGDKDGTRIVQELLYALPEGWGRCLSCFLATIAEQALLAGKVELAGITSAAALPLAAADSRERQRLLLYSGAAEFFTGKFQEGLASLASVQQAKLSENERTLLYATMSIIGKVRKTPVLSTDLQRSATLRPTKGNRAFPVSGPEQAARRAIADADATLNSTQ
jgi:chemotaxis protein MotC